MRDDKRSHLVIVSATFAAWLLACGGTPVEGASAGDSTGSSSSAMPVDATTSEPTTAGAGDDSGDTSSGPPPSTTGDGVDTSSGSSGGALEPAKVHVVLFTHVEDAMPTGMLGSPESVDQYMILRTRLTQMAELAQSHDLQWVLQPDWKILEAARQYEGSDENLLRQLHEDLGVVIDPHSHENGGYNYTDVAYLLDVLGVGGSTVIGGHIWDPTLPQYQAWDRFRRPLAGQMYPEASWRGDILIGSGTPNHVNDPILSGLWRPIDPDHYFTDDPDANIVAVGAWHDDVAGVQELVELYADGTVPADVLLTASWNINPADILAEGGLATIEDTVLLPLVELRDQDAIVVTDFTTLVDTWQTSYGGEAFLYQP